jgi:hypothetical protein
LVCSDRGRNWHLAYWRPAVGHFLCSSEARALTVSNLFWNSPHSYTGLPRTARSALCGSYVSMGLRATAAGRSSDILKRNRRQIKRVNTELQIGRMVPDNRMSPNLSRGLYDQSAH